MNFQRSPVVVEAVSCFFLSLLLLRPLPSPCQAVLLYFNLLPTQYTALGTTDAPYSLKLSPTR
jgi:hypothetical protein